MDLLMNKKIPLILAALYILFISLFAFDTPILSYAFLIHLIPSFVLILFTLIASKMPKLGGILFILSFVIFTLTFHTYKSLLNFSVISLPLFIIGILFLQGPKLGITR
jgi:hypothetical protein